MSEEKTARLMRWTPEEGFDSEDLLECLEYSRKRARLKEAGGHGL